ncbi:(2Fe-2S) ferredoxin domain-containing protein [Paenibacillus sedimenti]|uniref:(2Fe-2S) ferredoxin domain-containing protein n=1 Tax=Paenibacillus sedimenti TaxID=2770274 RepID=A0A926QKN0_9BACL|nr:(2Fe-2S) ferredoxin domain-containing protein [Paenibacillus sedimenti]MBD0382991.1 (2Fe-2S) ferredoxin domain-containing protein [Paenibacillus sedimenti]
MSTWDLSETRHHVLICNGASCMRKQGEEVTQAIRDEIARNSADGLIHTSRTHCNGRCQDACVVIVYPEGVWYKDVTPETGRILVNRHLLEGNPIREQLTHTYDVKYKGSFVRSPNAAKGESKQRIKI